jgi:hypothetical protein
VPGRRREDRPVTWTCDGWSRTPRILSSSPYPKRRFVHQYRSTDAAQLDDAFAGYVRAAYAVGRGAHLVRRAEGRFAVALAVRWC